MKNKIKTTKLKQVLRLKRGYDLTNEEMNHNGKYPVIGSSGLIGYHDEYKNESPTITVGRSGSVGDVNITHEKCWAHNTTLFVEDYFGNNPYYIYYLLKNLDLRTFTSGSTVPTLNRNHLDYIPVVDFSLEQQNLIGSFLSSYDMLIKENDNFIKELNNLLDLVYNFWFTQFDFPNEDGEPYKSSGGKMVWNEKMKREIPEGWEVKNINEIVESINTGLNPRTHFKLGEGDNNYVTIKNIVNGGIDFSTCDKVNDEAIIRIQERSGLKKGDILFTSITPIGRTYYLNRDPHKWNINESVFSIRADKEIISDLYLYSVIGSEYFKKSLENRSTGSIMGGIRIGDLRSINIVIPPKKIMKKYHKIILPLVEKIDILSQENTELMKQRDFLLPLLMNGQVTIE